VWCVDSALFNGIKIREKRKSAYRRQSQEGGGGRQRKSVGIEGKLDIINLEKGERIAVVYALLAGWQTEQCIRFMILRKKGKATDV
jgi:hypothetical protein